MWTHSCDAFIYGLGKKIKKKKTNITFNTLQGLMPNSIPVFPAAVMGNERVPECSGKEGNYRVTAG